MISKPKVLVFIHANRKVYLPGVLDYTSVEDFKKLMKFQLEIKETKPRPTPRNVEAIGYHTTILELIRDFQGEFIQFYLDNSHAITILEVSFPSDLEMTGFVGSIGKHSGISVKYAITATFSGIYDFATPKRACWKNPKWMSRFYARVAAADGTDTDLCLDLATFFNVPKIGSINNIKRTDIGVSVDVVFKKYDMFKAFEKELEEFFA